MFKPSVGPCRDRGPRGRSNQGVEVFSMKRVAALTFGFLAIVLAGAGTTAAAEGSYGPWEPIDQAPIAAPAGLVCPFTVTAEPVLQKLRIRYHYEDAGAVDGYQVTGLLVARITNAE